MTHEVVDLAEYRERRAPRDGRHLALISFTVWVVLPPALWAALCLVSFEIWGLVE